MRCFKVCSPTLRFLQQAAATIPSIREVVLVGSGTEVIAAEAEVALRAVVFLPLGKVVGAVATRRCRAAVRGNRRHRRHRLGRSRQPGPTTSCTWVGVYTAWKSNPTGSPVELALISLNSPDRLDPFRIVKNISQARCKPARPVEMQFSIDLHIAAHQQRILLTHARTGEIDI